jgi:hypothetical protein
VENSSGFQNDGDLANRVNLKLRNLAFYARHLIPATLILLKRDPSNYKCDFPIQLEITIIIIKPLKNY